MVVQNKLSQLKIQDISIMFNAFYQVEDNKLQHDQKTEVTFDYNVYCFGWPNI